MHRATTAGEATAGPGLLPCWWPRLQQHFPPRATPECWYLSQVWLGLLILLLAVFTTDVGYWNELPILLMGLGMPFFFFISKTSLALASIDELKQLRQPA